LARRLVETRTQNVHTERSAGKPAGLKRGFGRPAQGYPLKVETHAYDASASSSKGRRFAVPVQVATAARGREGRRVMSEAAQRSLRVLIGNERRDRLELLARVVTGLGHEVIAREIHVKEVGAVTARERPDVALVGLGLHSEHALDLITEIVREAFCPVIALLSANDPAYVREAAKRGIFAYIVDGNPEELQGAIDITLKRFAEYHSLQGAFGRRAVIEQAKGILMARHAITADRAFDLLRGQSQRNGRKVVDVAEAVVESHLLLVPPLAAPRPPDELPS